MYIYMCMYICTHTHIYVYVYMCINCLQASEEQWSNSVTRDFALVYKRHASYIRDMTTRDMSDMTRIYMCLYMCLCAYICICASIHASLYMTLCVWQQNRQCKATHVILMTFLKPPGLCSANTLIWVRAWPRRYVRVYVGDKTHTQKTWLVCKRHETCIRRPVGNRWHAASAPPFVETWLAYKRRDSCIRDTTHTWETWLIYTRHDSFIRDMTHLYETWLIYKRHDSYMRDMTHI